MKILAELEVEYDQEELTMLYTLNEELQEEVKYYKKQKKKAVEGDGDA